MGGAGGGGRGRRDAEGKYEVWGSGLRVVRGTGLLAFGTKIGRVSLCSQVVVIIYGPGADKKEKRENKIDIHGKPPHIVEEASFDTRRYFHLRGMPSAALVWNQAR